MKPKRMRPQRNTNIDWGAIHRRLELVQQSIDSLAEDDPERQEQILRDRAMQLAKIAAPAKAEAPSARNIETLVFLVAGERYAFETAYVGQVYPMCSITSLPGVPDFVVGIIASEGDVLSVIDLRLLLDLPLASLAEPTSIIVLKGETMEFGILAEEILGIEIYPEASIEQALPTLANTDKTYLKGIARDRTGILDAGLLLADSRLVVEAG